MMWAKYEGFLVVVLCVQYSHPLDIKDFLGEEPLTTRRVANEIIEYFKSDDPHGIPILSVPDPLPIGGPIAGTTMTFNNLSISGHSQLRLEHVEVNLKMLQAKVRISFPFFEILANYEWPGYWATSEGDMNITFVGLHIGAICDVALDEEGYVVVKNLEPIFEKETFIPTFTGLIAQHYLLVSVADTFFDSFVLPLIQQRIKEAGVKRLNERLKQRLTKQFPVDVSPVDFMIAKVKKERKIDPLHIKDREISLPIPVSLVMKNTALRGLSSLHRTNSIKAEFVDNRVYLTVEVGTQGLKLSTDWSLFSSLFPLGAGHADVIIESFQISLEAQQEADIRHPPIMRWVDLKLGNIALRSDGERNVDYLLEALVNYIPNIFRNLIMDRKVEATLKRVIQEKFNAVSWEQIIEQRLKTLQQ